MSQIKVDSITDEAGTGAPNFPHGAKMSGADMSAQAQATWEAGTSTTESVVSPAKVKAAIDALVSGVPAGTVITFAASTAPTGFLKANGAAVSRSTYSALFSAIGTTFGSGDGATTFNLPDLRGEFIRGWDDGRGVDSGRGFGSFQNFQLGNHRHLSGVIVRSNSASPYGYVAGDSNTWDRHQNYSGDRHNYTQTVGGSSNGSESRPRNRALLACIKF